VIYLIPHGTAGLDYEYLQNNERITSVAPARGQRGELLAVKSVFLFDYEIKNNRFFFFFWRTTYLSFCFSWALKALGPALFIVHIIST